MAESRVGRIVDNKYELISLVGRGGMSNVWLARDHRLGKLWAVKEMRLDDDARREQTNRRAIIDEAHLMKRLDHPAIPRIVDIIEAGRELFVVMDYVEGRSLSRVLQQRGSAFAQEDVIAWGVQLCDVLGYLHGLNPPVVYRDLKPGNVMLREDKSLRLVDFGIADEQVPGRGGDGRLIGSPCYSAPEQVDPAMHALHATDARSDVYALGTTLFSLVTGILPRKERSSEGKEHVVLDLRPLDEVEPGLSEGLERIIARATMRDPDLRYQTMDEMRHDLEHHEELTDEYQQVRRQRLRQFRRSVCASVMTLLVGLFCVVGSVWLRNSSYEGLMHVASVSSAREQGARLGGEGEAEGVSEAEQAYTRAIEVAPGRIEPYLHLVEVYKADGVFTAAEELRWTRLWQRHGRALEGNDRLARLCYDVGVLFLCYYDHLGLWDGTGSWPSLEGGQEAVRNATQSSTWFKRALEACRPDAGFYAGLEVDGDLDEYAAASAYVTIGEFYELYAQASREGRDTTDGFRELWQALQKGVLGVPASRSSTSRMEPMVRLRLCHAAFEAIASPTYLGGFKRAGVSEREVVEMLAEIERSMRLLEDFALSNRDAAGAAFDEVMHGLDEARDNVLRTFKGPVAQMPFSQEGDGGGGLP